MPTCGGKDADMWSKDADMWWKTYRGVVKRCRQEKNLCDKANEDLLKQMKIYTSVRSITPPPLTLDLGLNKGEGGGGGGLCSDVGKSANFGNTPKILGARKRARFSARALNKGGSARGGGYAPNCNVLKQMKI
jgi:hypothetical protein